MTTTDATPFSPETEQAVAACEHLVALILKEENPTVIASHAGDLRHLLKVPAVREGYLELPSEQVAFERMLLAARSSEISQEAERELLETLSIISPGWVTT